MKKRIIALLLTFVMIFSLLPVSALAMKTEIKITEQPESVTARTGETVSLTVSATGGGAGDYLYYMWVDADAVPVEKFEELVLDCVNRNDVITAGSLILHFNAIKKLYDEYPEIRDGLFNIELTPDMPSSTLNIKADRERHVQCVVFTNNVADLGALVDTLSDMNFSNPATLASATELMGIEITGFAISDEITISVDPNAPCLKHTLGEQTVVKEATCAEAGVSTALCSVCGNVVETEIPALPHTYENGVCTVCGAEDPNYVAAPVISIKNTASSGKPTVSWAAVDNAVKYEVYRATSKTGTFKLQYTTTKTSYTNTGATAGYTYYYKVKAVAADGTKSDFSNMKYTTCDCAQPVVTIACTASSGKPKLSWSAVKGATKYEVYRATSKSGTYTKLGSTTNTSYTNTGATAGKTYYYKVKAICGKSSYGNSAYSTIKSITCDCARPVVKITTSNGDPKLSWVKVTGATKYEVYRATSKSGTYTKMLTTTKTSYTNTSAKAGKTYYYKVKAVCGATSYGNSAYSTVKSIRAK